MYKLQQNNTIKNSAKYILCHIIMFVIASIIASYLSNQIFDLIVLTSYNISMTLKGVINTTVIICAFYIVNRILQEINRNAPPLLVKSTYLVILIAVISILIIITLLFSYEFYLIQKIQEANELRFILFALFAQSLSQEVLFRGILFKGITKCSSALTAALCLSGVFAVLNILIDGANLLPFISATCSCFILCMLYHWKQSLILNAIVNTSWLYVIFLTGVLDEHWRSSAPVISIAQGEVYLSGGAFGPDASILGITTLATFSMWFYVKYKTNKLV